MNFYARDLYPDTGMFDTGQTTIPEPETQRTLEENEKAVAISESTLAGATKKGTYGTLLCMIGIIAVIAMLTF